MKDRGSLHLLTLIGCLLFAGARAPAADCNRNGVEDFADVTSGSSRDCNENGVPDDCDVPAANLGFRLDNRLYEGQRSVFSVVVEDFDADGDLDLAAGFNGDIGPIRGRFRYWSREPSGFEQRQVLDLPIFPLDLDVADFDRDGALDVAAAGFDGSFAVMRNLGGLFELQGTIPVPEASDVAPADFDSDGDVDVAVAGDSRVNVLWSQGDFDFVVGPSMVVVADPTHLIAGDFDGDTRLDLVTANVSQNISLIVNVDGTSFAEPRNFAAPGDEEEPRAIAGADLDEDGDLDVVVSGSETAILLNPGNGRFNERIPIRGADVNASGVAIADLEADGDLDIAAGSRQVYLVLNHGGANFAKARSAGIDFGADSMAAEDVTGDGDLDLIIAADRSVSILTPTLIANSRDCDADAVPDECELGINDCNENDVPDNCDLAPGGGSNDCNGNAVPDECEHDCNENGLEDACDIRSGTSQDCNTNGRPDECDLAPPRFKGFEELRSFSAARHIRVLSTIDAIGDGRPDIAAAIGNDLVLFANSSGDPLEAPRVLLQDVAPGGTTTGDYDGNGANDLAVTTTKEEGLALLANGGNELAPGGRVSLPTASPSIETADIDGDGQVEILAAMGELQEVWSFTHSVEGGLRRMPTTIGIQGSPAFLRARDLDGDGDPEIVLSGTDFRGFIVLRNEVWGNSFTPLVQAEDEEPTSLDFGDFNHDGLDDIVFLTRSEFIGVFENRGGGDFEPTDNHIGFGDAFLSLAVADFDDDLLLDIATLGDCFQNDPSGVLEINFGDDDPGGGSGSVQLLGDIRLPTMLQADMDQDGQVDIVAAFECSDCGGPFTRFVKILRNATAPFTSRDFNRDRIPDECQGAYFHRGDSNQDGRLDLADAVATLLYLYRGAEPPSCIESADFDNDGSVAITDPILVLNHLFQGGSPPAAPGPPSLPCGLDPDAQDSPGALGCDSYTGCR